jgi:hypothetical protein
MLLSERFIATSMAPPNSPASAAARNASSTGATSSSLAMNTALLLPLMLRNRLYADHASFDPNSKLAKKVRRFLDYLKRAFPEKTPKLERYNAITLYCLASTLIQGYVHQGREAQLADCQRPSGLCCMQSCQEQQGVNLTTTQWTRNQTPHNPRYRDAG